MITYRLENEIVNVDYIMYIDYSFSTLWKRMPKTNIYINLVVEVILIYTITLFVLYYRKQQKNRSVSTVDITSDPNIITDPISVDNTVETEKQTNSTIKRSYHSRINLSLRKTLSYSMTVRSKCLINNKRY